MPPSPPISASSLALGGQPRDTLKAILGKLATIESRFIERLKKPHCRIVIYLSTSDCVYEPHFVNIYITKRANA